MLNRSRVTTGFVETVACTSLENERCKKWEERSTFGSMGSVKVGTDTDM